MSVDSILQQVTEVYGSLSDPRYGRLRERLGDTPYGPLIERLRGRFTVDEDLDLDHDHGWCLFLLHGSGQWGLDLSAVGPYAAFGRVDVGWTRVLHPAQPDLAPVERWTCRVLAEHGVQVLDLDVLSTPVPMRLPCSRDPRIYQALFTDTDTLPWDRETLARLGLL